MEFGAFLKVLKKHKFTIIIIPVITIIITYFLVRNQADSYSSQAKIATGIVDQTQKSVYDVVDAQESKINQEFSNLIEMIKSKRMLDQLAYKLMIHDLTSNTPYRKPSALLEQLNASAKQHAVATYTDLYNKRQPLSLFNADQNGLNKLLASMHYDDQSIQKSLYVYRVQNSDYINIQFESENAELSAIVVNTLCTEFINYYSLLIKTNQQRSVEFWANLLRVKQDTLNSKMMALKNYKIRNHVLNLNEKAKSLYGQMADFETRREEVEKNTHATQAAINNIDKQFDPADRRYSESNKLAATQQVLSSQEQLKLANDAYIQSGFDSRYQRKIDSLKGIISTQLGQLSDKYVLSPLSSKQDLVDQKLGLQIQNELAKNSSGSVNKELSRLNDKFDSLVPHEAATQALESAVNIASQEYLEILQKYNQANMESSFATKIRVVENADPGIAQPSKKMLLVIIGGIISFVFCIAVLFILFFFDNAIKNPRELANLTKVPVLGYLNLLSSKTIDLHHIWNDSKNEEEYKQFKNLMRSVRFEVDTELSGDKILLINSLAKAEGKTFAGINLAYAYVQVSKKVLLIDANFNNPDITASTKTKLYLEDFLNGTTDNSLLQGAAKITYMGNKGGDTSILEVSNTQQIQSKLTELKSIFDVIIIEAPALDALNRSKEWTLFAEKIVTVFEAGKTLNESDRQQIKYLKDQKGKFIGWILNLVSKDQLINE